MTSDGASGDQMLNRVLLLLAPAITIVVASEFIVVGLLPLVSKDMQVPLAKAGELAGWWAFSAAIAGPIITLAVSRWPPRVILVMTLACFAIGNAVVALSTSFPAMLTARIAQGAMLPAFVSIGAAVVTQLAHPAQRGEKLARANIGFVLGVLLALPSGVALAKQGDWRLPFLILAAATLPLMALIAAFFPATPRADAPRMAQQLGLLRRPTFLTQLVLSALLFAAMFAAYTYFAAWLEEQLRLSIDGIALTLLLFGAAGLVGNAVAGRIADRIPLRAATLSILMLVAAVNLAASMPGSRPLVVVALAIWGMTQTASVTLSQVRVTLDGGEAPAFAMTMNISAANLGIAIGTWGGGWLIDRHGVASIGLAPIGFALLALPLLAVLGARVQREAQARPSYTSADLGPINAEAR